MSFFNHKEILGQVTKLVYDYSMLFRLSLSIISPFFFAENQIVKRKIELINK